MIKIKKLKWVAVEVKSSISSEADITIGIFKCIKYNAVMNAVLISKGNTPDVRVVLVLEGDLPNSLIPLKNLLGVEVISNITPHG